MRDSRELMENSRGLNEGLRGTHSGELRDSARTQPLTQGTYFGELKENLKGFLLSGGLGQAMPLGATLNTKSIFVGLQRLNEQRTSVFFFYHYI